MITQLKFCSQMINIFNFIEDFYVVFKSTGYFNYYLYDEDGIIVISGSKKSVFRCTFLKCQMPCL